MRTTLLGVLLAQAPGAETTNDRALEIGSKLRCPVCQGQPIAESGAEQALDMMAVVREMCAEGRSEEEITQYFVDRYGEWVRLEPTPEGMNLSLWILPAAALLIGALVALRFARGRRDPAAAEPRATSGDRYLDAIRDEVER